MKGLFKRTTPIKAVPSSPGAGGNAGASAANSSAGPTSGTPPRAAVNSGGAAATATVGTPTLTLSSQDTKDVDRRLSVSDILFSDDVRQPDAVMYTDAPPSAAEVVLKSFLGQWLALVDAKLREYAMAEHQGNILDDESFQTLLRSIGRVARRATGEVVNVVLAWRRNKTASAAAAAAPTGVLQRAQTNTTEDRFVLGAELLTCETLINIVGAVNTRDLESDAWCQDVEQLCFANVVPAKGNNEEIRAKYALVLGGLAPFRLLDITAKFKTVVQQFMAKSDAKNQAVLEAIVDAMSKLRLDISSANSCAQVIQYLTVFVDLVANLKGKQQESLRPMLVQTLAAVLRPLMQFVKPLGVDYSKWHQFVNSSYATLYSKLVEPKNPRESRTPCYTLLVTLLCMQEKEVFLATYSTLADHITTAKTIKKDKKTGTKLNFTYLLEALYMLADNFFAQDFSGNNAGQLAQSNFLELITNRLFEIRDKKLGPLPDESLDLMVSILTVMAQKNAMLTLRDIGKLLVANDPGFLQKKIVGVRALMRICEVGIDVMEHAPTIADTMSEAFAAVHQDFGGALLTAQKPPLDDRDPNTVLMCETIESCFYIMPIKIGTTKLFSILASYLIHSSGPVRAAAEKCISRILTHRVGLRSPLIQIIAELPLSISDQKPAVLEIALEKLNLFISRWNELLVAGSSDDPFDLNISQLEGIALVFLCSSRAKVRLKAWKTIELLRTLASAAPKSTATYSKKESPISAMRLLTVMEELEADTILTFNNDFRFRRIENPTFRRFDNMTLQSLIANEATVAAQLCWTFCLGHILRLALVLCPEAVTLARNLCVLRYAKVPMVVEKTITQDHVLSIGLWRNYATMLCVATNHQSFEFDDWVAQIGKGDSGYPPTPQVMLQDIIVKTATNPLYQQPGAMALGRICPALLPTMCAALDEIIIDGKGISKKPIVASRKASTIPLNHWEILSSIYSKAAEGLVDERGLLQRDPVLRKYFISHLSELVKFVTSGTDTVADIEMFPLRFSLLVLIRCVAEELNLSQRGAQHEMDKAVRQSLFQYVVRWSSAPNTIDSAQVSEQILAKLRGARINEKPEEFKRALRDQLQILQYFAVQAAGALISSPWDPPITVEHSVVQWLDSNLRDTFNSHKPGSNMRLASQDAITMFLFGNHQQWGCIPMALNHAYTKSVDEVSVYVANTWFLAIVELMEMRSDVQIPIPEILHLVLCKVGDSSLVIRRNSLKLLQLLSYALGARWEEYDALAIDSELDDTYRHTQLSLSGKLAEAYAVHAPRVVDEMVLRVESLGKMAFDQAFDYIVPWVATLKLYLSTESMRSHTLYNLCLLTHLYQADFPMQVQRLWVTLAQDQGNVDPIVEFLLRVGVRKRNPAFTPLAKKIVIYISRASGEVTVGKLVDELQAVDKGDKPKLLRQMSPRGVSRAQSLQVTQVGTLEPDHPFHHVMPDLGVHVQTVSRYHLALILTSELAFERGELLRDHLSVILQQLFLGFHHPHPIIYDHSRMLLLNLVHSLVIDHYSQSEDSPIPHEDYEEALQLAELLKGRARKPLFQNSTQLNTLLTSLVETVVSVLSHKAEEGNADERRLSDLWAEQALQWALKSPILHLASISYQIYRALCPSASKEDLTLMLESLSRFVKVKSVENEKLTLQIILTLRSVLDQADANNLTLYTQVFWGAAALLNTDLEEQFTHACTIIEAVLSSLNFSDMVVSNVFLASTPETEQFQGVQTKVIRGLWAPATEPYAVKLLVKMLIVPPSCDAIIQSRNRVLSSTVALLPGLCIEGKAEKAQSVAEKLGRFAVAFGFKNLGNTLIQQSKSTKDVQSFLSAVAGPFVEAFFPAHAFFVFKFFFDLLERGPVKYNKPILQILVVLVGHVDLHVQTFQQRIPRWMAALERLVHGPLVQLALDLMDLCMAQSSSKTTLTNITLPKSTDSGGREEFTNTQEEGCTLVSAELAALVKRFGLGPQAENNVEELASQAFFAKFFPESDDSGSSHNMDMSEMSAIASDTMKTVDDFNDEMLLGGFGGGDGGFFNLMDQLDHVPAPASGEGAALTPATTPMVEKHSQLHDQFNNYFQQSKFAMAAEMAFELGDVLLEGYGQSARTTLPVLQDDEVKLLISKHEKMLQGQKLLERLKACSTGFKSSVASQKLLAVPKADRGVVEKALQAALSQFNEQHTAYLAAQAVFDKKAQQSDKSKAGELKLLNAIVEAHLQLIKVLKKIAELRVAFDVLLDKVKDMPDHLQALTQMEEKNRTLQSELQSL